MRHDERKSKSRSGKKTHAMSGNQSNIGIVILPGATLRLAIVASFTNQVTECFLFGLRGSVDISAASTPSLYGSE